MTKMIQLLFLSFFVSSVTFAQQAGESLVPAPSESSELETSKFIDPDTAAWKKVKKSWQKGDVLKALYRAVVFLKKRQDSVLENQHIILRDQNDLRKQFDDLEKKQQADVDRHEAGIKHLSTLFTHEKVLKGG